MNPNDELRALLTHETALPVPPAVTALTDAIQAKGRVAAVLFYGSGLWQAPTEDMIYDFYVLVDRFRDFEDRAALAFLGTLLPPNVYYLETTAGNQTVRGKFAVLTTAQFAAAAQGRAATPQVWARFAQPCRIAAARDDATRMAVIDALAQAVLTFHRLALQLVPPAAEPRTVWLAGLSQTYGAELRPEAPGRTARLFGAAAPAFEARTALARRILSHDRSSSPPIIRPRRQKLVALLRLMKAAFTFQGGVDYLLWKVRRQSGVSVEATDFQRRHPLLAAWPLVWRLYRLGGFR